MPTRGIGIFLGCTAAMLCERYPQRLGWVRSPGLRRGAIAFALACLALLTVVQRLWPLDETMVHRALVPVMCASFTWIVVMLWYGPDDTLSRVLRSRPLSYIGRISYGVYLYHLVAAALVWDVLLAGIEHWNRYPKYGLRVATFLALSLGLATLSYRLLERPFLKIKDRLR